MRGISNMPKFMEFAMKKKKDGDGYFCIYEAEVDTGLKDNNLYYLMDKAMTNKAVFRTENEKTPCKWSTRKHYHYTYNSKFKEPEAKRYLPIISSITQPKADTDESKRIQTLALLEAENKALKQLLFEKKYKELKTLLDG